MPRVLHLLPHPGGGGERFVDLLEGVPGYEQERAYLSRNASPLSAIPAMTRRWRGLRHAAAASDLIHLHGDTTSMLSASLGRDRAIVISSHGLSMLRRAPEPLLTLARA